MNVDDLDSLSIPEKLQLIEALWDSITVPEQIPMPEWQKEELARRKANHLQNPGAGSTWEEVKARIRNQHGE